MSRSVQDDKAELELMTINWCGKQVDIEITEEDILELERKFEWIW